MLLPDYSRVARAMVAGKGPPIDRLGRTRLMQLANGVPVCPRVGSATAPRDAHPVLQAGEPQLEDDDVLWINYRNPRWCVAGVGARDRWCSPRSRQVLLDCAALLRRERGAALR